MTLRRALLAVSLLLAAVATVVTAPIDAAAQQDGDIAPVDVVVELRVWQHVRNAESIWVSARPKGGDWRTLGTIPFPLDDGSSWGDYYRYGDLVIAGAALRIWQRVGEPERISVCGNLCPDPSIRTIPRPLGAIQLPLDDGHSSSGQYRYGDLTVATIPGNPDLLADRVQLLRQKDTLAGTGTLDWDHDTPMTTWTGVNVGGTPPRVTKLQLANSGLNGELSGLLGNLTGLEELRLDGNALTGAIPSKLGQLTNLTHAYLGGNALTRCVPPPLRTVVNNDIASLGLPDCLPPLDVSYGEQIMTDGSYLYGEGGSVLIFDVPAGVQITIDGIVISEPLPGYPPSGLGLLLGDVNGRSWMGIDTWTLSTWRWVDPDADGIGATFDRIEESAWFGAPDTPSSGPPTLTAVAGGGAREILLEWTIARAGATRWQYRQWGPGDTAWGAWTDIAGSDADTTSHRLTGLPPDGGYAFQVRPWTAQGAGDAYDEVQGYALRADADGIPVVSLGVVLEGGRRFSLSIPGAETYTFTVPRGLPLEVVEWVVNPDGTTRIRWEEPASDSYMVYDPDLGRDVGRGTGYGAPPNAWALFDELLESIEEEPLP